MAKIDAAGRRWYTSQFKGEIVARCLQPSASVSGIAVEHGLNPNMVRKWIERNAIGGEWLAVLLDALGRLDGQPSPVTPFIGVRTTYPKREADIFG